MPEGPEVETEKLHEAIHEEVEHHGGGFLRAIALTTSLPISILSMAGIICLILAFWFRWRMKATE